MKKIVLAACVARVAFADITWGADANGNEQSVGTNLNAINNAGLASADLLSVINSLTGQSSTVVNPALDQLHPAAMSAFAELQTELGGQLLNLFHRTPQVTCGCSKEARIWVEPFGNWLEERPQGKQIGFEATTAGIAFGGDYQFYGVWTIGFGGAWNTTDLTWKLDRGHSYINGLYGSFYTDLLLGSFYFGSALYAGGDWYETARRMQFTSVDRTAHSNSGGFDFGAQVASAYYFGIPICLFYPYVTVDYLLLNNGAFSESGANSLDLHVDSYHSSTLRSEAGIGVQVIDKNYNETVCITPSFAIGWVMELPLHRSSYTATFAGQTIPFTVEGWEKTWQLFNLRFGLGLTLWCFNLDSQYQLEVSGDHDRAYFAQRANFRLSYTF